MNISDLPPTTLVGETCDYDTLATYIQRALGDPHARITHVEPVYGSDHSYRVLYTKQCGEAVALPAPATPAHAAREFKELLPEARCPLPKDFTQRKGWSVSMAVIAGERAVVVRATWLD